MVAFGANESSSGQDITDLLRRTASGEWSARNALAANTIDRLRQIVLAKLRKYPSLLRRGRVDVDGVVDDLLLELLTNVEHGGVQSEAHFFNFARWKLNYRLIDKRRRFRRELQAEADAFGGRDSIDHLPDPTGPRSTVASVARHAGFCTPEDDDLTDEQWTKFHQAAGRLTGEQRLVFGLSYYGQWSRAEIAAILGVSERTVTRRLNDAKADIRRVIFTLQ